MRIYLADIEETITVWAHQIRSGDYGLIHYRVYLFGSCVKGKENPNDIDVAVECLECENDSNPGRALALLRVDAHGDLSREIGIVVNVEEYDKKFVEAKLLFDSQKIDRLPSSKR